MLRKFRIAARLSIGFGVLLVFLLAGFGLGLVRIARLNQRTEEIVSDHWVGASGAAKLNRAASKKQIPINI